MCKGFAGALSTTITAGSVRSSSVSLSEDDEDDELDERGASCRLPETVARIGRKGWTIAVEMASAESKVASDVRSGWQQTEAGRQRTFASLEHVARPLLRDWLALRSRFDPAVKVAISRDVVEADPTVLVPGNEVSPPPVDAEPTALV